MKYRADAFCLSYAEVRRLLPTTKTHGMQCPLCHAAIRHVYVHPLEPYRWGCVHCLKLLPGNYRPQAVMHSIIEARDKLIGQVSDALTSYMAHDMPRMAQDMAQEMPSLASHMPSSTSPHASSSMPQGKRTRGRPRKSP
jgi:hypothetical protein